MLLRDIIQNNMTLVEGVGDEVFQCFVAFVVIFVVYVAWWTTNIPDRGHSRAVFLLDRSPRSNQTLTRHTNVTAVREDQLLEEPDSPSTSVDQPITSNQSTDVPKPPEGSTNRADRANQTGVNTREEQQVIIEAMDAITNTLGQRDPLVNGYNSDSDEDETTVPVMLEVNSPSSDQPSNLDPSTEESSSGAELGPRLKDLYTNMVKGEPRNSDSDVGNHKTFTDNFSQLLGESHSPSISVDQSTEGCSNKAEVEDRKGDDSREVQAIMEAMDAGTNQLRQRNGILNEDCTNSDESDRSTNSHIEQISSSASQIYDNGHHDDELKNEITIKLKYLNDEIKIVSGSLEESLDDFKKRHFPDLSANKIVKLIFNGHVLQPDSETLKTCGLYQDCVVHCLIQNRNPQSSAPPVGDSQREIVSFVSFPMMNQIPRTNDDRHRDWDLGNLLFGLASLMLFLAWYFRYMYAHMYTATATVGLILITVIFAVFVVGTLFPDIENSPLTLRMAQERRRRRQI